MNLTILGATSGIGLQAVQQALAQGHTVTALARGLSPLPDQPRLRKLRGSATTTADVRAAIAGADAVLITVGTSQKKGSTLFRDTARALLAATAEAPFPAPVLVVTGFGVGDSAPYLSWLLRLVVQGLLKEQSADKAELEALLAGSPLNWTVVRPGRLTNDAQTKNYKVLPHLAKGMKVGPISRADVADFLLREAEKPTFVRQRVAITGKIGPG